MRSSYVANHYGQLFEKFIVAFDPSISVELGVLDGYSTISIAKGLKSLGRSKLYAYDLFEAYPYNHGSMEDVRKSLEFAGVSEYVDLLKGDAYKVYADFPNDSIDFLHIDLSNTGDIIRDMMSLWHPKMSERSIIFLEGGSDERDRIEWMTQYKKFPIKRELETNRLINDNYFWSTYNVFPSLTVLIRKEDDVICGKGW